MIRRVLHLARLSLRAALRSRFVLAVLALLALVAIVLPQTIRGDGTPASDIRMLLTWTLGVTVFLLGTISLWAGCNAFAGEIEEGVFVGVAVTPTRRLELWLGKWIGLTLLDAGLLLAIFAVVTIQLPHRGIALSDLRPYRWVQPSEEGLRAHAAVIFQGAQAAGHIPADATPDEWIETILEDLHEANLSINPGDEHAWKFTVPTERRRAGEDVRVRVTFTSPLGSAGGVSATCRVLDAAGGELASCEITPDDRQRVEFPIAAEGLANTPTLTLAFRNTADADGTAVLVGAVDGAVLFFPQGSFWTNLLLAGLALGSILAALAGLGVAAGAMFSLPVAVFVASAMTVIGLLSQANMECHDEDCGHPGHAHHHHEVKAGPWFHTLDRFATSFLHGVKTLSTPVEDAAPLDRLGDRRLISVSDALRAVGLVGVLLPLLAGCVGVLALRCREFP